MRSGPVWAAILLAGVLAIAEDARGETAGEAFDAGKARLAEADFQGALSSFARAARADRHNPDYLQHYTMVRQVIALRQQLGGEQNSTRWEYVARGLRAFYVGQGLHDEALGVDEQIHARTQSASSAVMLAETQLALEKNAEAAKVLSGLAAEKQTAGTRALYGLALARQGKLDEARQLAASIRLSDEAGPGELYIAARFHAAVGRPDDAFRLLSRCFESVAPSRLEALKTHARESPELAALAAVDGFPEAMATESKVAESTCSSGSSCAGCPMRGQCSSDQDK